MRKLALIFGLLAAPVSAHEFWIEPLAYQVETDGNIAAHIVNGQNFEGTNLPFVPQRFAHFVTFAGGRSGNVEGRVGDLPALQMDASQDGLHVFAYQARNATVDYATWEKFETFVTHKDLPLTRADHDARDLPETDFIEVYSRYSKSLVGVGSAAGADRRVGLETEFVALTNPYTDSLADGMKVQLFYRTDVRADEQVEVFEKAPSGEVLISLYRTDAQGIATIPVKSGHSYMVDAVVLRDPAAHVMADTGAVYETLWANLTFFAP